MFINTSPLPSGAATPSASPVSTDGAASRPGTPGDANGGRITETLEFAVGNNVKRVQNQNGAGKEPSSQSPKKPSNIDPNKGDSMARSKSGADSTPQHGKIRKQSKGAPTSYAASALFKVTIFFTLAFQNASIMLLTRYCKVARPQAHSPDNDAHVVVWGEIVKLWISIVVVFYNLFLRNPFTSPKPDSSESKEKLIGDAEEVDDPNYMLGSTGLLSTKDIIMGTPTNKAKKEIRKLPSRSFRLGAMKNWDCDCWEEQFQEWCGYSEEEDSEGTTSNEKSKSNNSPKKKKGSEGLRKRKRVADADENDDEMRKRGSRLMVELSAIQQATAVVLNRFMKPPSAIRRNYNLLIRTQMSNWVDFLLMTIPGCIYLFQNRLIFFAYSKLPGPVFQVTYQLKILTGAFVARFVLKQILSWRKWIALILLVVGVVTVQVDGHAFLSSLSVESATMDFALGILASVVACLCSGCAGVYFEKVLKGGKVDLWVRNVHLAVASVLIGAAGNVIEKEQRITPDLNSDPAMMGRFLVYDFVPKTWREMTHVPDIDIAVWFIILLHSVGGILVSLLIKYMNNTMKAFAASCAILIASLASVYLFPDFELSPLFWTGFTLVASATYLYMV